MRAYLLACHDDSGLYLDVVSVSLEKVVAVYERAYSKPELKPFVEYPMAEATRRIRELAGSAIGTELRLAKWTGPTVAVIEVDTQETDNG
jgi:hypothetical protein